MLLQSHFICACHAPRVVNLYHLWAKDTFLLWVAGMAGNREQRLPDAARLYHEGAAPKILLANDGVFAGWSREYQRNLYLVEWAREDLLDMGVPWEDIVLLEFTECGSIHDVLNTRDYVLSREDIRSLLVVTSDYHARRTLWSFRHVFREKDIRIGVNPAEFDNDGSRLNNLPWPCKWPSICSAGLGMACTYSLKFTFRVKRPNRSPHLMLINGPSLQVVFTCL